MKKIKKPENYHILDSIDLRAFDNREKDYGVGRYLHTLGFLPDAITLLECSVEQVHAWQGTVDGSAVPYLWTSERAMPGGNVWSQRQLYGDCLLSYQRGTGLWQGCI